MIYTGYTNPKLRRGVTDVITFGYDTEQKKKYLTQIAKSLNAQVIADIMVGGNTRMFVFKNKDKYIMACNPSIKKQYSVGDKLETCPCIKTSPMEVNRPEDIDVSYLDENGDYQEMRLKNEAARSFHKGMDYNRGYYIVDHYINKMVMGLENPKDSNELDIDVKSIQTPKELHRIRMISKGIWKVGHSVV